MVIVTSTGSKFGRSLISCSSLSHVPEHRSPRISATRVSDTVTLSVFTSFSLGCLDLVTNHPGQEQILELHTRPHATRVEHPFAQGAPNVGKSHTHTARLSSLCSCRSARQYKPYRYRMRYLSS